MPTLFGLLSQLEDFCEFSQVGKYPHFTAAVNLTLGMDIVPGKEYNWRISGL